MKKRIFILSVLLGCSMWVVLSAQTVVTISDTESWSRQELSKYVGQTIRFATPFYVNSNNKQNINISPRRLFTPTNQAIPESQEYTALVSSNSSGYTSLSGVSGYHRLGERIIDLTVKVNSVSSVEYVSGDFVGNTRADMEQGYPSVDMAGEHTLTVCGFNLEYYLVENLGTGYGADDASEHAHQKAKIADALDHIRADIFGFVEIEQGQSALRELAEVLTEKTGKQYSWVDDGGSANGSYTKSGYVYCTETVEPYGDIQNINNVVTNRKKMQGFREKATGETFIYSINHYKAKAGSKNASGLDKDQGDGQGAYNASRVKESEAVLSAYNAARGYYSDEDILIMGDLNAYAKEDPIITLLDAGMTDLHRYFHRDSSYSYVYGSLAGYLDHAIVNSSLLAQVTGVQGYHINSDESDSYTYDKSSDYTMFRCSDHDPVIVGLRLGASFAIGESATLVDEPSYRLCQFGVLSGHPHITRADGGYFRIFNSQGTLFMQGKITSNDFTADRELPAGMYIVNVYVDGRVKQFKYVMIE